MAACGRVSSWLASELKTLIHLGDAMPLRPFGRRSQTVLVLSEKDRKLLRELIEATQNNHRPATELALPTKGRWNTLMRIGKVIGGILAVASLVLVAVQTKNGAPDVSVGGVKA
jgi:hypothetical protein